MQLHPILKDRLNEPWNDVRNYEMLRDPAQAFTAMQLAATHVTGEYAGAYDSQIIQALNQSGFVAALHEIARANGKPHRKKPDGYEIVAIDEKGAPQITVDAGSNAISLSMWLRREKPVSAYLNGQGCAYTNYREKHSNRFIYAPSVAPYMLPTLANWVFETLPSARAKLIDQAQRVNCVPDEKAVRVPSRPAKFFNDLAHTPHARMDLLADLPHDRRQAAVDAVCGHEARSQHRVSDIIREVILGHPDSVNRSGNYELVVPGLFISRITDQGGRIEVASGGRNVFLYEADKRNSAFLIYGPWLAEFYQRWPQANSCLESSRQALSSLAKLRFSNG